MASIRKSILSRRRIGCSPSLNPNPSPNSLLFGSLLPPSSPRTLNPTHRRFPSRPLNPSSLIGPRQKTLIFAQNPCFGLSFTHSLFPPFQSVVNPGQDPSYLVCVKPSSRSLYSNCFWLRFYSNPTRVTQRKPGLPYASGSSCKGDRNRISRSVGVEPTVVVEIVGLVREDASDLESKLSQLHLTLSQVLVVEILRSLNDGGVSALRFFNWVLNSSPGLKPNSEIYNQIVDNLGRLDDYSTMLQLLKELSSKGHCLTEKAFTFLMASGSGNLTDSIKKITAMLNEVGGSCRGSGIFSLIKLLCVMRAFDLAIFVMGETARRTSYFNILIAAKCRNGDLQAARDLLGEMRRFGCDPNTKSYNYLLGSLFKNKRVVEACELLQIMEELGYIPDGVTFEVVVIHACKANRMDFAIEFLDRMLSDGLKPRLTMHAAFIKGYFWSGRVEDAYSYVIDMSKKDRWSSNMNFSLLANLFRISGRVVEASRVLQEMMEKGLKPNFSVYMRVFKDLQKITLGDLALELKSMFLKFS